jgi:sec-independent protein translocase protein TatA
MEIGFQEMVLIGIVLVVFFGPKKLPELGEGIAKGIKEFRRVLHDTTSAIKEQASVGDSADKAAATPVSPASHDSQLPDGSLAHSEHTNVETTVSH